MRKASFKDFDSILVGCGTVLTGKKQFFSRKSFLHFQERTVEEKWNFTYLLTYLLTPWSRVLFEKLTNGILLNKIRNLDFYQFLTTYLQIQ
jgi:hypothetical protein